MPLILRAKGVRLLVALGSLAMLLCPSASRPASITLSPSATCAGDTDVLNLGGGYAYN